MDRIEGYLKGKNVLLLTCVVCRKEGVAEYFRKRAKTLLVYNIATRYSKGLFSTVSFYEQGKVVKAEKFKTFSVPQLIDKKIPYFSHLTYLWPIFLQVLFCGRKFDLCFAEGQLFTLVSYFLKKMGWVKRVIYSSGDYFTSVKIYQTIDAFVSPRVDAIWNATAVMSQRRQADLALNRPQQVMPLGLELEMETISQRNFSRREIIHMGNLQERHGLNILAEVLPGVCQKYPDFHLHVVGSGPYRQEFEKRIQDQAVENFITFHGFISGKKELDEIFARVVLGLALYAPEKDTATSFTDPGKIKDYLSYGLPILTTRVPQIATEIEELSAGWVIEYEAQALEQKLMEVLSDLNFLKQTSEKSLVLARRYLWNNILDSVFDQTLETWHE